MLFYLCDGKKDCAKAPGCHLNGGDCKHCVDPDHAKNGAITDDPFNHRDRFEPENFDIGQGKIVTYFWEFDPEEISKLNSHEEEPEIGENDI